MAEKRYYWLKLKEGYLDNPKIKKLRKIAGGDTYTIIYLKMQLLSIANNGIIEFEEIEKTIEEELALKLDEQVEDVQLTLSYLRSQSLIETNSNNEILFLEASNNIGTECDSAERVRLFREREKMLQCNEPVTEMLQNSISNSISNISTSNNIIYNNKDSNIDIIKEIIDYLNNKAQTSYKYNSSNSKKHISARLNEKYTIEDFYKVIDNKCLEWLGTDFEKFLRPETLFGSKFESYLNQKTNVRKTKEDDFMDRYEIKQQQILKSLENE